MKTYKYIEIKNDIIQKILNKELSPREKVSSESELKEKYGVSSTTVVKALNELVSEGYIYRVQGKGSFISKALRGSTVKYFENDYKFYNHSDEKTKVISITRDIDEETIDKFYEGTELKKITRLKFAGDQPILLTITVIDANYLGNADEEQLKSIYDTVRSQRKVNLFNATFEENFRVLYPAPKEVKELMNITENEPVVSMVQQTYSQDNKLIEYICSYKKFDYFDISITSV